MKRKQKNKLRSVSIRTGCGILAVVLAVTLYWYLSFTTPKLPSPPLKDLAAKHNVALGIHATVDRLSDKPYDDIIKSQYSFINIDGELAWSNLRPAKKTYDYSKVDKLVNFAATNGLAVQMHHLVWGEKNALPKWLKAGNYNKQQLLDIIHDHINNVAGRYKGQVAEWTVVNEAFTRGQHIYGIHDWWGDHMGGFMTYIDDSFKWARQADPHAKLLLNDFYNETENKVSDAEYNYVKDARARGVPIDGIGIQMHIDAARPPNKEAVIKNFQRFGALRVPIYITEFDITTNYVKGSGLYKRQLETQITYDMVRACIESKSCISFNNFGLTDKENLLKWLTSTNSRSFLFDSRYRPKSSFDAFRDAWETP